MTAAEGGDRALMPDARTGASVAAKIITLLDNGELDAAKILVERLYATYPRWGYAWTMHVFFERLPAPGSQPPFADDLKKEVQIVRRDGADSLLLVFAGADHKMGFSLAAMHRWFGRLPVNLAYLRDFRSLFYLGGIPSLGPDVTATAAALRDIAIALGVRRILCCGCSSGLHAALHYGLTLGAEAVLGLAGPTNLSTEFNTHLRSKARVAYLWATMPQAPAIDLHRLYSEAARAPRVLLVYDRNNWDDRLHAEHLAGLPTVRLDPLEDRGGHAVISALIRRGLFDEKLNWLVQGVTPRSQK
jgi:hypothetical protein